MRRTLLFMGLLLVGLSNVALAQPGTRKQIGPPPPQVQWDSKGWQLLGEKQVDGRVDRDRIEVGRYEGRFNKLTVVVKDSDLELIEFKIVFGDRTEYNPKVSQYFRENTRTKVIDLPPAENIIRYIDFKYRNLPGGGRATVQVYGFKIGDHTGPGPGPGPGPRPPVTVNWDSRGWTLLGSRDVDGRVDRDRIQVGRYEGRFSKLTIVVRDSDLELIDFGVKFARGPEWKPNVAHYFRENQRTHVIDFPGDERVIKYIDFKYRNLPGGGKARIEVWAWKTDGTSAQSNQPMWDQNGWTMLGEQKVGGGRRGDRDRIRVGRDEGRFRQLTIVVLDSDIELYDVKVKFGRGPMFDPRIKSAVFREGTRTRVIDLPGDRRVIRSIEFAYRNLPGGGKARVQVWGK
ncbi:MAG: hypothetical protein AB7T06_45445 [Kofleriaceae bacterium]